MVAESGDMMLGIITARAGEHGATNKNLFQLNGKPLIEYTIDVALKLNYELKIPFILTTDDNHILSSYVNGRITGIRRPDELCQKDTPSLPVLQHAVKTYEEHTKETVDSILLLQPTSPLRTFLDVANAISLYRKNTYANSLYSGYKLKIKHKGKVFDKHKAEPHFQRNGAIFIASRQLVMEQGKLWDEYPVEYEMPFARSVDIDTLEDFFIAESLIKNGVLNGETFYFWNGH